MVEPRDRLTRHIDVAIMFSRTRSRLLNHETDSQPHASENLLGSPLQQRTPTNLTRGRFRRRGRGRPGSILPPWFPRAPLQDITEIMRVIESGGGSRERATAVASPSASGGGEGSSHRGVLEEEDGQGFTSPVQPGERKVAKILAGVRRGGDEEGGEGLLTPQKRLLNSLDTVEMAVKEELHKLNKTPQVRRAERKSRVRTLMSMR